MGWDDNRGVSEVLGAMLLFGIVIMALGSYQAFVVPQQNAETELNHDTQVSDDFAEIQASISNAAASGKSRTTSVMLGTRYRVRAAGLNPPTVSGQLSTRHEGEINVNGFDGNLDTICGLNPQTRMITYRADYNELDGTGTLVYENGVTYRDVNDQIVIRNDQELVDGSTIRLFPLTTGAFSTGSSTSEQLRFVPGETGTQTVNTEGDNLTLTFPSPLEASTWEDNILEGRGDVSANKANGKITLTFNSGLYQIQCTPVGIGSKPSDQDPVPTEEDDNDPDEVNPSGEGAVTFESAEMAENSGNTVEMTLRNRGEQERLINEIRVPYYSADSQGSSGGKAADKVNVTGGNEPDTSVGGDYSPAAKIIQGEATSELTISFFCENDNNFQLGAGDFFMMNILFNNGEVNSYFINAPTTETGNNPCNNN